MEDLSPLDGLVIAVIIVAIVRGLFIGMIREGFSIAALGGSLLAIRYTIGPAAAWLEGIAGGEIGPTASTWIAGVVIAIAVVVGVGLVGRVIRKGAHAVGLGWADRIGGGAVGAVEGTLVGAAILLGATWALGHDNELLAGSRSMEVLEKLQDYAADHKDELPDVSSPAEWLKK